MKILVLGIDGYIGWPLALDLLSKNHEIAGVDNFSRRYRVERVGSTSLTPISNRFERTEILKSNKLFAGDTIVDINLEDGPNEIGYILNDFKPDTIIHLAEQPSAPWSMKDPYCATATQSGNVIGTLNLLWAMRENAPEAHLIKLGTMGEYGTPDCDIPEGEIPIAPCIYSDISPWRPCPMSGLPFPRSAGSIYHLSKVHDTHNIIFACKTWGLRSTDIMQGVVFGLMSTDSRYITRFDYDQYFGTAINRFCASVLIGHPITIYGKGYQTRGFLPLKDSIQCINIILNNPPELGEYRTFNQFENIYRINDLASEVHLAARKLGLDPSVKFLTNPRDELDEHYYNPAHKKLFDLGYIPTTDIKSEIHNLIKSLIPFKERVCRAAILPTTTWR